jgi:hypothetical protein
MRVLGNAVFKIYEALQRISIFYKIGPIVFIVSIIIILHCYLIYCLLRMFRIFLRL